jgi:hypothetical protein
MDEIKYISFTTGSSADTNPPEVVASFPADGETVPYRSVVAFDFSEDMLPSSVEAGGIIVEDSSSSIVTGAIIYVANIKSAVFFPPNSRFAPGETFTATVNPLLVDLNGNMLSSSANDTITFQTNINQLPVAKVPVELFSKKDSFITLDGSGSYDPEGEKLVYYWTASPANPETLSLSHNNSADADRTIIRPTVDGFYQFDLVVDDGNLLSTAATVDVYVGVTPTLLEPQNMENIITNPVLMWEMNYGSPSEFHILLDNDSDFSSPILDIVRTIPSYNTGKVDYTPYLNMPVYWKISATDIYGHTTDFSETFFFQIITEPPALPHFTNWIGNTVVSLSCSVDWLIPCYFFEVTDAAPYADLTVEWENVGADYYRIYIYKYGAGVVFDTGDSPGLPGTTLSYSNNNTLDEGDYYIALSANNVAGWTYPPRRAHIKVRKGLNKPVLEFPANVPSVTVPLEQQGAPVTIFTFDWHLQEPIYYGKQKMVIYAEINGETKTYSNPFISRDITSYTFPRPFSYFPRDENNQPLMDENGNHIITDYWYLNWVNNPGTDGFSGENCEQIFSFSCTMDNIYQGIVINWKIVYVDMFGREVESNVSNFRLYYNTWLLVWYGD